MNEEINKRLMNKPLRTIIDEIEGLEYLMESSIFDQEEKGKIKGKIDSLYQQLKDIEYGN